MKRNDTDNGLIADDNFGDDFDDDYKDDFEGSAKNMFEDSGHLDSGKNNNKNPMDELGKDNKDNKNKMGGLTVEGGLDPDDDEEDVELDEEDKLKMMLE